MKEELLIRTIQQSDNSYLAKIVRDTLTEFGCNKPGTAFADPETDFLFEQFTDERTEYFVVEINGKIVGGSGIGILKGYIEICELQKMYLTHDARGKGIANQLMNKCIAFAKEKGYKKIYLETMPELNTAVTFYTKNGFEFLDKPLSQTGHFSCNIWMIKEI
ncbi:MAG: GNAT family N-acetyltransferase [Bacteroidia bacterium]